jgi:hypothetical protein
MNRFTIQTPRENRETDSANPRYGWLAGTKDTYYTATVYTFDDDDPHGFEIENSTLQALCGQIHSLRKQTLAKSRPNGWDDDQAFQVSRPVKHIVQYV